MKVEVKDRVGNDGGRRKKGKKKGTEDKQKEAGRTDQEEITHKEPLISHQFPLLTQCCRLTWE